MALDEAEFFVMADEEMKEKPKIIVIDKTESFLESFASDIVSFGFLALCIWFSHDQGGGWWTFFTCTLFLIFLSAQGNAARITKFRSKRELIEWANSLPDDGSAE